MSKKQTLLSTLVIIVIVVVFVASIWLIWKYFISSNNSSSSEYYTTSESGGLTKLNPNASENISLEPKANESGQSSSSLKVDGSQSNSANLGSGSRGSTSVAGDSTSQQQDFSQYEQYKDKNEVYFGDLEVGTGAEAVKDSQLAVTYTGYLTNGQVFDKSRPANNGQLQPFLFTLGAGKVIPGFEQGIAGMKVGGSRRVIIPPSLGYGENAQGSIPANSVPIFDISLMTVQ